MPSFIATLATMSIFAGLTLQFSQGNPVKVTDGMFLALGQGNFLGIPTPIWIMLVLGVLFGYILARTRYGRELYAMGDNADAARLAGISTDRVKIVAFMISGVLAATAGFILTARLGTAQPTAGTGLELAAIAAVIIGGTSLSGGRGALLGTLVGAVLLAMIDNGLNLLNVSPFLQSVVKGAVILLAVFVDRNSGVLMRIFRAGPAKRQPAGSTRRRRLTRRARAGPAPSEGCHARRRRTAGGRGRHHHGRPRRGQRKRRSPAEVGHAGHLHAQQPVLRLRRRRRQGPGGEAGREPRRAERQQQ